MFLGRVILVGLIWLFSLKYYLECRRLPDASESMTVSAVFWLLTVFTVIEFFSVYRRFRRQTATGINLPTLLKKIAQDTRARIAALTILYLGLIPGLGFFTASFIAFAVFSYVLGNRGFFRIIMTDSFVLVIIYVIFSLVLKLTLPTGILI